MSNKLVARLCLMYGPPETADPPAWFSEMDKLLKGYNEAQLDKAADLVLRTHRGSRFPSVSEMLTAAEDATEMLAPRRILNAEPNYKKEPVHPRVAAALQEGFMKAMNAGNAFVDIKARCPIGGKIDVSKPWGEEVTDRDGNIVPIRTPKRGYAA